MSKKEILWRYLLHQAITNKKQEFVQKELARKFGFSLSTINNALKAPREIGAIKVTGRNFLIENKEKFLYLWATNRKLTKEIVYETSVSQAVKEIEAEMPAGVIFGAYSAYLKKYQEAPADYDKVYIYADEKILDEIKQRFPAQKGHKNLFVLKSNPELEKMSSSGVAPAEQIFADIWNLSDWYAKDFLQTLKEKIL